LWTTRVVADRKARALSTTKPYGQPCTAQCSKAAGFPLIKPGSVFRRPEPPLEARQVSQAFCSALPVAYCQLVNPPWARFATLVLEAAYEATLLAARLNRFETGCPTVFLTRLGGGVFGNEASWVDNAMARALEWARGSGLDVRLVSFSRPSSALQRLARQFNEVK